MPPTLVVVQAEAYLHKRVPTWFSRLPYQMHPGLLRGAVGLARVARDAGTDDIFPRGRTVLMPWNDVIQIQITRFVFFAAILASILITLKNIVTCEFNLLARHTIVH